MRIGLAANRLHHHDARAALFRWLRASEAGLRELGVSLHAVGRTHDAIERQGFWPATAACTGIPTGARRLRKLVAEVVGMGPERTLDGAIYLIGPGRSVSVFPEATRSSGSA